LGVLRGGEDGRAVELVHREPVWSCALEAAVARGAPPARYAPEHGQVLVAYGASTLAGSAMVSPTVR